MGGSSIKSDTVFMAVKLKQISVSYQLEIILFLFYREFILFSCGVSDRSNNTIALLLDTSDSNTIPFKV